MANRLSIGSSSHRKIWTDKHRKQFAATKHISAELFNRTLCEAGIPQLGTMQLLSDSSQHPPTSGPTYEMAASRVALSHDERKSYNHLPAL
jgi:hypothetical protein